MKDRWSRPCAFLKMRSTGPFALRRVARTKGRSPPARSLRCDIDRFASLRLAAGPGRVLSSSAGFIDRDRSIERSIGAGSSRARRSAPSRAPTTHVVSSSAKKDAIAPFFTFSIQNSIETRNNTVSRFFRFFWKAKKKMKTIKAIEAVVVVELSSVSERVSGERGRHGRPSRTRETFGAIARAGIPRRRCEASAATASAAA